MVYENIYSKLEASQDLKKIMTRLKYGDEIRLTKALNIWYIRYKFFLNEKELILVAKINIF